MTQRLALSIAALLVLSACASAPSGSPPSSGAAMAPIADFRAADFAWSTGAGTGRVDGQLTFKANGKPYSCADAGVVLTPETPWTRQRMTTLYKSASYAALPAAEVRARTPRSADYSAFIKRASCDPAGGFTFAGLPNGAWYVITVAKAVAPAVGADMAIMRRIEVRAGKAAAVKL